MRATRGRQSQSRRRPDQCPSPRPRRRLPEAQRNRWRRRTRRRVGRASGECDGHSPPPDQGLRACFQDLAIETGPSLKIEPEGFDFAIGGPLTDSDRSAIVPIGIVAHTGAKGQIRIETLRDAEDLSQVHFGGGPVVAAMGARGKHGRQPDRREARDHGGALGACPSRWARPTTRPGSLTQTTWRSTAGEPERCEASPESVGQCRSRPSPRGSASRGSPRRRSCQSAERPSQRSLRSRGPTGNRTTASGRRARPPQTGTRATGRCPARWRASRDAASRP